MNQAPEDNPQATQPGEDPQLRDTSKAEPIMNKRTGAVAVAVTATLAAGVAAHETGVLDHPTKPKPPVERIVPVVNTGNLRPAGPGTQVTLRVPASFRNTGMNAQGDVVPVGGGSAETIDIRETSRGSLVATADGQPVAFKLHLPTNTHEGPEELVKDASKHMDPHVDYVSDNLSEKVSERHKDGATITTTTSAPYGEDIQIHSDGDGGLVASHDGKPVITTLELPAPPPKQR